MKKILLTVLSLLMTVHGFAYRGRVFLDKNKDGCYDRGEKLLSDVLVSDGLNVVKTNNDGTFNLPGHKRARFISVTTPSGFKPVNTHYFKIDTDVESYDFARQRWDKVSKDGNHSFIQITDTEIRDTNPIHSIWMNNIRDYAHNEDVGFIVHTGDICYEGGLKAHIKLMNSQNMGLPVYYGVGNHDLVKGTYGEELFESLYGPVWYSFDYGNVHYIMTPMHGGDYLPSYKVEDLYNWLKNDLSHLDNGQPIVIFNHNVWTSSDEFIVEKNDHEKLYLNRDFNLKAWIYGHWHNHFIKKLGGVKTISTSAPDKGGIDYSTSAFRLFEVDDKGDINTQLRYTYIDNNIEIASIGSGVSAKDEKGNILVNVNTYLTQSPTERVSFRVYTADQVIKSSANLRQNTDWNWSTAFTLPKSMNNQEVFVEATAYFANGQSIKAIESFTNQSKVLTPSLGNEWTNLVGNSSHTLALEESLKNPLQLAWINNVGANIYFTSPVVKEGVVYVATLDEELRGEGGIYALDAKSGKLVWTFNTRNSVKNTIAIDGEYIFAQDAEGYLYAVHTKTGKLVWEAKLDAPVFPAVIEGLATHKGIVYAGIGKSLTAFDAKTGDIIWKNEAWAVNQGTTSTISVNNDYLIMGTQWGALHGHNAKNGKHLWSLRKDGISDRGSSPALYGNIAYFISRNTLFIIDAQTGDTK